MKFKQLHELVNEGKEDDDFIKKMADFKSPISTNTLANALKSKEEICKQNEGPHKASEADYKTMADMHDQPKRDFEEWWDSKENYKMLPDTVRDTCKACAMNAWFEAMDRYY